MFSLSGRRCVITGLFSLSHLHTNTTKPATGTFYMAYIVSI